jgi:hypothetical protein
VQKDGRTKLLKIPVWEVRPVFKNGKGEDDHVL